MSVRLQTIINFPSLSPWYMPGNSRFLAFLWDSCAGHRIPIFFLGPLCALALPFKGCSLLVMGQYGYGLSKKRLAYYYLFPLHRMKLVPSWAVLLRTVPMSTIQRLALAVEHSPLQWNYVVSDMPSDRGLHENMSKNEGQGFIDCSPRTWGLGGRHGPGRPPSPQRVSPGEPRKS